MQGNTSGRVFRVTAAGESYGPALQIIVDGVPPGVPITDFLMMWNGYKSLRRDMEGPQLGQEILSAPDA